MPAIQGQIVEYWTRKPVPNAVVSANGRTTVTDAAGRFSLEVPMGVVSFHASHPQFHPFVTSFNITAPRGFNVGTIRLQSKVVAL